MNTLKYIYICIIAFLITTSIHANTKLRIISLAPSVTEEIFLLHSEDNLIAVSKLTNPFAFLFSNVKSLDTKTSGISKLLKYTLKSDW